jgi:hypothetical protein
MAINRISGNILQDDLRRGSDLAIQGNLIYFDITNNRVGVRTSTPADDFEVDGILRVGAVSIDSAGNIDAGNVYINNLSDPVANSDAATKFYVDAASANSNIGNFSFADNTISLTVSPGNITLEPTANSLLIIDTTSGVILPVGNTAQRPSPAEQGTTRFNNETLELEFYDGLGWQVITTEVTNQTANGDGSTVIFALDRASSTAAVLISLNGVIQLPTAAYTVSGNVLTFTEAPLSTDVIDIRFL